MARPIHAPSYFQDYLAKAAAFNEKRDAILNADPATLSDRQLTLLLKELRPDQRRQLEIYVSVATAYSRLAWALFELDDPSRFNKAYRYDPQTRTIRPRNVLTPMIESLKKLFPPPHKEKL